MVKLIPLNKREKIKELRQKGYSLPEISQELKIGRASVFRYIQGVAILPQYQSEWRGKQGGSIKRMKIKENLAKEHAEKSIPTLTEKEKLIFLSALYWGEGGKTDFNFINSDPTLIRVFIKSLTDVLKVSKERIRISIRIYEDMDKEKCLDFWSKITEIPIERLTNVTVLKGKKIGKLQYGICRVRITKGGDMLKYIKALYKRASDVFEFS